MVPKYCAHCETLLPAPTSGRGGNQTNRKFCSTRCKGQHRYASKRKPQPVKCEQCGEQRMLLHPHLAGKMCLRCAAEIGSAVALSVNTMNPETRFMNNVSISEKTKCWNWTGTKQSNGYSAFGVSGKTLRGHRWSYEHFIGPIPEGLQIDHLCRNRACVNPDHLEPVTAQENTRRAMRTHCVNGHEFSESNTYMHGGKRYCRTCRRARNRAQQAK